MKISFFFFLFFISFYIHAQELETLDWINNHAIEIEDSEPDTGLSNFDKHIPEKFLNAQIFGFGEASHHGKEFFTIKAKFFKYLVRTQNLKVFIMEESYPAEAGINEWISGGKGDLKTIANNFSIIPWYNQEVVNLLEWMRNYNLSNPNKEKIRFYGMDIQNVEGINRKIRDFVKKNNVAVNENLLSILDSITHKKIDNKISPNWADKQLPKLEEIEQIILYNQKKSDSKQVENYISVLRALNYLKNYTYYLQHAGSEVRDQIMFENVKWIIKNRTKNGKAFIWAHNEHINNGDLYYYNSGRLSLGAHLKEYYGSDYYSVYFDFGVGELLGRVTRKNKSKYWDAFKIEKPFRNTYAMTLWRANKDIYFIDMSQALKNEALNKFFSDKKKQLQLGAQGYSPKNYSINKKQYSKLFDGLIFIKNISVPNYEMNYQ